MAEGISFGDIPDAREADEFADLEGAQSRHLADAEIVLFAEDEVVQRRATFILGHGNHELFDVGRPSQDEGFDDTRHQMRVLY